MTAIKKIIQDRIHIAILFFFISAAYGFLLRWQKLSSIPFNYRDILQAHSHVTFLGWGFLALISVVTYVFMPELVKKPFIKYSYWVMSGSIIGMLISFPLQGYKLFSILFLSIFLLSSYVYLWQLYTLLKTKNTFAIKFIRTGILYYYLSSVAIWVIPIISIRLGKIDLYHNAIYFYLHFLYNGFFVFTLFGMLVYYMQSLKLPIAKRNLSLFYLLTNLACLPAYALSLLWNEMPFYSIAIGFFGAVLQVISLLYLWRIIKVFIASTSLKNKLLKLITIVVIGSYFLKVLMQFAGSFPEITLHAVHYKPYFVIGYIHLFTLGFMSLFLFLLFKLFFNLGISKWGISLFILGVVSSEVLLFSQGFLAFFCQKNINNYDLIMLMASFLMPLGLFVIGTNFLVNRLKSEKF